MATTDHSVAAGVDALLTQIRDAGHPPLCRLTPEVARRLPSLMRMVGRAPQLHRVESVSIPTPAGQLHARA